MSASRWLKSPLAGTAGVLAGLCLLSIPLRHVTSRPAVAAVEVSPAEFANEEVAAVLRLRLLAPARRVVVTGENNQVLLDAADLTSGESEYDIKLLLTDEEADLTLSVEMVDPELETAVFLTLMPDGREEQTAHVIGAGLLEDALHFAWPHAH
jgi:hypothetical protein